MMVRFRNLSLASLLILWFPVMALAAGGKGDLFGLLEAGRIKEAQAFISQVPTEGTSPSLKIYLEAQLAFYQQKYEKAEKLLTSLKPEGIPAENLRTLRDLIRETRARTASFVSVTTRHFDLRYAPGKDAILPLYAGEALETARERIGKDLGEAPATRMVVEFYPHWKDFMAVSTLTTQEVKTSGTVALCKFNRMMVTTPRALYRGYGWIDTVVHEYAHYVINRVTDSRAPVWLHEGIAKYEEVRWRKESGSELSPQVKALLKKRLDEKTLIPFARMHPSMAKLDSSEDAAVAFAQVFYFLRYVVEERGSMADLRKVLEGIRQGQKVEEAFATVFKEPFDQFYAKWEAWLNQQTFPQGHFASLKGVEFQETSLSPQEREAQEQVKIESEQARDFLRIGDLLLEKGRAKAAYKEYKKAHRLLKTPSPFLLNKLAYVALEVGEREQALRSLNEAARIAPDYPATWVRRGLVHLEDKNYEEAERDFLKANSLNPFDPQIHVGLLEIYEKQRKRKLVAREKEALQALGIQ